MTKNFQEFLLEYKKEISLNTEYKDKQEELKNSLFLKLFVLLTCLVIVGSFACLFLGIEVFIILLIISLIIIIILPAPFQEYKVYLKTRLYPKLLSLIGDIKHSKYCIEEKEITNCGLFQETDNYPFSQTTDDEFEGIYKGINFKICETKISYSGGEQLFSGIIIIFDYNKTINKPCCVLDKKFINKKQSSSRVNTNSRGAGLELLIIFLWDIISFIKKLCSNKKGKEKKVITLEDPQFMKRFKVESEDEVEARYLLTPSFMERFYNFKTVFEAEHISCAFYDNKFMVLIGTYKDLFETGDLFQSLDNPKFVVDFYNEVNTIFQMIDYFKLDEKTGL